MIRVKVRGKESVEQMVRRFKKLCEKEGLNRDIKRTSYFEKPSERKRRKMRKSLKRIAKDRHLAGHYRPSARFVHLNHLQTRA